MKDCSELLLLIKQGEAGVKEAMKEIYLNSEYQKIAAIQHRKFSAIKGLFTWEDIFVESIKRFIDMALAEKAIANCDAYFYGICRNYCNELVRKSKKAEGINYESNVDNLFAAVQPFVSQLGRQCQILLGLLYFHHPPYNPKERDPLVEKLKEEGYNIKSSSISTVITRCKKNLKEIIGNKLDDFDQFYNF